MTLRLDDEADYRLFRPGARGEHPAMVEVARPES